MTTTTRALSWSCLGYCLMDNHYHLLVRTPAPDLPVGMKRINERFTCGYNARHRERGHVFQGRYHAELLVRDSHLLEALRYVPLNPVRAGLCSDPVEYPWSSLATTLGRSSDGLTAVDEVLAEFADGPGTAADHFSAFVAAGVDRGLRERTSKC